MARGGLKWTATLEDGMSGPATRIAGKLGKVSDKLDEVGKSAATAATRQRGANGRFISSADKLAAAAAAGDTALVQGKRDVNGRLRDARGKYLKEAGDAVTAESGLLDRRVSKEQKAAQKIVKNREMLQARLDRMTAREKARKAKAGGVSIGGAVAAGAAAAMVSEAAQMAYSGARVIMDAQIFRESTIGAFTRLLGSADKAKQAWKIAEGISLSTGANLQETASSLNSLLAQGMTLPDAEILIKQMADLKALNPAANLEGITRAMMQIKSTGKLQGDELMQLAEAGLSIDRVYEQLSKTLGKSRDEVLKLQQTGKITSAQAIKAIQDSIAAQTKSAPGALAADAASKSLGGSINRIQAMMDVLMSGEGIDMSPVVNTINTLMAALQRPEVQAAINSLFNALIGLMSLDFFGAIGADSISKTASMSASIQAFANVLRVVVGILAIFKNALLAVGLSITGWVFIFQKLWDGLLALGAGISAFASSVVEYVAAIPGRISATIAEFFAVASSIGSGIIDGIIGALDPGRLIAAIKSMAMGALEAGAAVLGIRSPSREFERQWAQVPAGAARGVERNTAQVDRATANMAGDSLSVGASAAKQVSSTSNSRTFAPNVVVNVNGGGSAGNAASQMADTLRALNAQFA